MKSAITACLPADELAELDRVCRQTRVGRAEAVSAAVRWYIEMEGYLPPTEDPAADEISVASSFT